MSLIFQSLQMKKCKVLTGFDGMGQGPVSRLALSLLVEAVKC